MRTWLLSAVAALALGLGATASDASAASAPPAPCAPVVARHMKVAKRVWVRKHVRNGHAHRYAHYRYGPQRVYRHRR